MEPRNDTNGFSMPAGTYRLVAQDTTWHLPDGLTLTIEKEPAHRLLDGTGAWWSSGKGTFSTYLEDTNDYADTLNLKIIATNISTGEETLIATVEKYTGTSFKSIPMPNNFFPLNGTFNIRCHAYTLDGIKCDIIYPDELYTPDSYVYSYSADTYGSGGAYFKGISNGCGPEGVDSLKICIEPFYYVCAVRIEYYDEDMNLIKRQQKSYNSQETLRSTSYVTFTPELDPNKTYIVRALTHRYDSSFGDKYDYDFAYAVDENSKIAEFTYTPKTITGIGAVTVNDLSGFKAGEAITVCTSDGRIVKQMTATDDTAATLRQSLPSGVYIVKSATISAKIKF